MNKNIKLVIIRGVPGSGKSTLAKKIAKEHNLVHFENDEYLMHDGKYIWTPKAAKAAAKKCFEDTMKTLRSGKSVVVSNTFITARIINRYVNAAEAIGAKVKVFRATGNFKNLHDVPDEVFNSMKKNFEDYPGEVIL